MTARRHDLSAAGLVLVVLAGQLAGAVVPALRLPLLAVSLLGLDGLGVVMSLLASRRAGNRTGWRLVAAGRFCSMISITGFAAEELTGSPTWWTVGVGGGLAMFTALCVAVLTVPVQRLTGRQRWSFFADMMTVLVAGSMVVGYFTINPLIHTPGAHQWVFAIGFPAGNLMLIAVLSAVLLRGTMIRLNQAAGLLFSGMLVYAVGDVAFAALRVHGITAPNSLPTTFCLVAADLLMTLGAMRQVAKGTRAPQPPVLEMPGWPTPLPYVAVVGGNALMLVVTIREGQLALWGFLVIGQIAMTGFVTLRQAISLRDSRELTVVDPLTGLANRSGLDVTLDRALRRGRPLAVLMIDLDGFKLINDAYGHAAGDTVLTEFARLIRGSLRKGDIGARIGGDEFIAVLQDITAAEHAVAVAQRILAGAAAAPIALGEDSLLARASIGISTGAPGERVQEVLRRADVAMYEAKRAGEHGWRLYDPAMIDRRARDAALADQLTQALDGGQLAVVYQPLVGLTDGVPLGAEALLRWQHPELGTISPVEFVPIAERTGLIHPIGLWVLEQACRQLLAGDRYASVNVSPRQLQEPTLVADVLDVLHRTGLDPGRLVLEVTESAMVDDRVAIPALRRLRGHGIRIAIDDFGTGYSSLHYLTRLPVDILKIDRSFVAELNGTPEGAAVTEAVIRLAQVLRLTTVAEGIETAEQAAELQRLGCNVGQGYHYARPMSGADLSAYGEAGGGSRERLSRA